MLETALASRAYVGAPCDAAVDRGPFLGEARFDGVFATMMWTRDEAAAFLAPGLRLARPRSATQSLHPVVFAFGVQSQTALLLGGRRWPTGFRYGELAVMVPFVQVEDDARLFLHVPCMFADDDWATWTGNTYYGFNKVRAQLRWFSETLAVSEPSHGLAIEVNATGAGAWDESHRFGSTFEAVAALAALPVLGRRDDGSFVASRFGWDWSDAALRAARAVISLRAPVARRLPRRVCHGDPGGTFELRNMRWRLSWPAPPGD